MSGQFGRHGGRVASGPSLVFLRSISPADVIYKNTAGSAGQATSAQVLKREYSSNLVRLTPLRLAPNACTEGSCVT